LDASELRRGSIVSSRGRFALYGDEIQSKAWNARLTPPIRPPDHAMAPKRSSAVGRSALTACRSSLLLKFDAHVATSPLLGRMLTACVRPFDVSEIAATKEPPRA
jgi:hypothetical protein